MEKPLKLLPGKKEPKANKGMSCEPVNGTPHVIGTEDTGLTRMDISRTFAPILSCKISLLASGTRHQSDSRHKSSDFP